MYPHLSRQVSFAPWICTDFLLGYKHNLLHNHPTSRTKAPTWKYTIAFFLLWQPELMAWLDRNYKQTSYNASEIYIYFLKQNLLNLRIKSEIELILLESKQSSKNINKTYCLSLCIYLESYQINWFLNALAFIIWFYSFGHCSLFTPSVKAMKAKSAWELSLARDWTRELLCCHIVWT